MINQQNFLAALAQLGQAQRQAPAVQLDANGNPLPMMQALQGYGPDVMVAGANTGLNPRLTNALREQAAGLNQPGIKGAPLPAGTVVVPAPGGMSQSDFSGYSGPARGRPVPPAEMLRKR